MTPPGSPDPDRSEGADLSEGMLVVAADDAALILHLLVTFERVLRHADLTDEQLGLLTPAGTGPSDAAADLLMAEVVGDAIDALTSQLGEP